jgi:hypothetical protein
VEDGVIRDTSGRGNDGILLDGAYYDATDKSLDLSNYDSTRPSGSQTAHIKSGILPGFTGNQAHTVSFWYKGGTDIDGYWVVIAPQTGEGTANQVSSINYQPTNGRFNLVGWSNDFYVNYTAVSGSWYHIVVTYNGTAVTTTNKKMYIDGVLQKSTTSNTEGAAVAFPDNMIVCLAEKAAGLYETNPQMSNFKLYDTDLTASEVKTLYDMGRMGSVANPKTLQIASSLDVRGRITREYYPGEVIEELHAVCDRTSLRGKAVIQYVNAYQNLSTSYADATGSRVEDYIIPKGTTNIVYEYSFHAKFGDNHAISHWRLYYQVNSGGWEEVTKARMNVAGQYYDEKKIARWVFEVGGTENVPFGAMDAKAGDSVDFRWYVREYSSGNEIVLHLSQYWDGGFGDQYSQPTIMIKAIA